MFGDHFEQLELSVLIPRVLVDALDRHNFICEQIRALVDYSKSSVCDDFVQTVLLPSLLLLDNDVKSTNSFNRKGLLRPFIHIECKSILE